MRRPLRKLILLAIVVLLLALGGLAASWLFAPNPLSDRATSLYFTRRVGLPVRVEGARVELRPFALRAATLVVGPPPGHAEEARLEARGVRIGRKLERRRSHVTFDADEARLRVDRAGPGRDTLADALAACRASVRSSVEDGGMEVSVRDLTIEVKDAASGDRTRLQHGRLALEIDAGSVQKLEVAGALESPLGAGTLEVAYAAPRPDLSLHLVARGLDLGAISPFTAALYHGLEGSGRADFELDVELSRTGRRFALAGAGALQTFALQGGPFGGGAIGEKRLEIAGGIEVDLAAARIRAQRFRLQSQAVEIEADGSAERLGDSLRSDLRVRASLNFERASLRYPALFPLAMPGLAPMGIADASLAPRPDGGARLEVRTEGFSCGFAPNRSLSLGEAELDAEIDLQADGLRVREVRALTQWFDAKGSVAISAIRDPRGPRVQLDLAGEVEASKAVAPISSFFGGVTFDLSGWLAWSLQGGVEGERWSLVAGLRGEQGGGRYDDLRPGAGDAYILGCEGLATTLAIAWPRRPSDLPREIEATLDFGCKRATITREEIDDLAARIEWRGGRIELLPLQAGYFGGRLGARGEIVLERGRPPRARVEAAVDGVELSHFPAMVVAQLTGVTAAENAPWSTKATNRVSGRLEVEGAGDSLNAMVFAATGDVTLGVSAGTIAGAPLLERWLPGEAGAPRAIDSLSTSARLTKDGWRCDAVMLRAANRQLRLAGTAFPDGKVDFAIDPTDWFGEARAARLLALLPPRALRVSGPFDRPELSLPPPDAFDAAVPGADLERLVRETFKETPAPGGY